MKHKSMAILAACFVCFLLGCSANEGDLYVVMEKEGPAMFGGGLTVYPFEELKFQISAQEIRQKLNLYDRNAGKAKNRRQLIIMLNERDSEMALTLFGVMPEYIMIGKGIPRAVVCKKMPKLDKKVFKNKEAYYEYYHIKPKKMQ